MFEISIGIDHASSVEQNFFFGLLRNGSAVFAVPLKTVLFSAFFRTRPPDFPKGFSGLFCTTSAIFLQSTFG